jgi:hypothetical protein
MGLKDRLATRKRPSTTYSLRIDSDDAARAELSAAQAADDEERIAAARAAVEACYEQLTITALPPVELEALLAAHPPVEKDRGKKIFDPRTFIPALFAACIKSDITTEEEWAEYTTTGAMTAGEVNELFDKAWEINYRVPSADLPKG